MRAPGTRTSRVIAALGALALLTAAPTSAPADDDERRPCVQGAPGIGDAYFPRYGNGGYDVRDYDIEVDYDPVTDRLGGEADIRARATQNLCSLNLDLVGLEVERVEVNGRRAQWVRFGPELIVTPRRPLPQGRRFEIEVLYGGVPQESNLLGGRSGFMTTPDGATVAGQPEVAASWFPVNDHPLDKAAYAFEVTVPEGYEVVANGVLRDVDRGRGSTTWEWEAREPMASYLATIDIGQWDVRRWRTATGIPVYDAVDSAITGPLRTVVDASLARQGEILDVLSEAFGPYPFSTVGAIVESQDDLFFALETQTRPVYSKFFWNPDGGPGTGDDVVVHELAHQWFGDDLALGRWQDIWLNEGFATYAEWLWLEREGITTASTIFEDLRASFPEASPFWSVVVGDPGVNELFSFPVYARGAMTLQALREEVGDERFRAIIRTWAAERSGGNVTTPEFIAVAERVAGRDLDELFTAWLFTAAKPAPSVTSGVIAASAAPSAEARMHAAAWRERLARRVRLGRH